MKRDRCLSSYVFCLFTAALPLLMVTSASAATPVQFVQVTTMVSGPPYPTGALIDNIVVDEFGTPFVVDQVSTSIGNLNPVARTDWFVADSFAFAVERDLKAPEGGMPPVNIGVGELQECTISKSMDRGSVLLTQYAVSTNQITLLVETGTPDGNVTYLSEFITPQPAIFTNVSVVPSPDARSFDMNFSLLYTAPYNPELSIFREVMTGNFTAIPEPNSALLLMGASASVWLSAHFRSRRPAQKTLPWL
jgi:hypothetical protein